VEVWQKHEKDTPLHLIKVFLRVKQDVKIIKWNKFFHGRFTREKSVVKCKSFNKQLQ